MGHRRAADAVVSGADSSQSSAESSFREHDDVFLQRQARVWLGEVLKTRLNEESHISDLLADGELLFEVSKVVWDMLMVKHVELRNLKAYQQQHFSRKSGGRYMPYSNVDSFLKICKVLGLNGIDLFSPSDVVERRDTRKVCICIRALSKKARSKQLNVPDFDVVSSAVAMPTEMVECIRRSLESSHCSFSSSSSCNSFKDSRFRIQQRNSISDCNGNYDSASDVSDEAESKYYGPEKYRSSENKFDNPSFLNLDSEISSNAFSAVKLNTPKKSVLQPELQKPYGGEFGNGDSRSVARVESVKSFSLHHPRNGHDSDHLSDFKENLYIKHSRVKNDIGQHYVNPMEVNDVDLALCNDDSSVRDSLFDNIAHRDFISDYLAFSDSVVFGADGSSPIIFAGENHMCDFFMGIDSHISSMNQKNRFCQKSPDDMEDDEVSSTASMSSILGRVLNMDFNEQFDARDSSIMKADPTVFLENDAYGQDRSLFVEDQIQELAQIETLSNNSATDIKESHYETSLGNSGFSTESLSNCHNQGQICPLGSQVHEKDSSSLKYPGKHKFIEQKRPGSSISSGDSSEAGHQESRGLNKKVISYSDHEIEDNRQHQILNSLVENVSDRRKDPISRVHEEKRSQRPLLKTFFGGTALVGALFLLLHISRRGQERTDVPSKQLNQAQKSRGAKSSSRKERRSIPNGTYSAENLKLGE